MITSLCTGKPQSRSHFLSAILLRILYLQNIIMHPLFIYTQRRLSIIDPPCPLIIVLMVHPEKISQGGEQYLGQRTQMCELNRKQLHTELKAEKVLRLEEEEMYQRVVRGEGSEKTNKENR